MLSIILPIQYHPHPIYLIIHSIISMGLDRRLHYLYSISHLSYPWARHWIHAPSDCHISRIELLFVSCRALGLLPTLSRLLSPCRRRLATHIHYRTWFRSWTNWHHRQCSHTSQEFCSCSISLHQWKGTLERRLSARLLRDSVLDGSESLLQFLFVHFWE